jgi:hypothetical protein
MSSDGADGKGRAHGGNRQMVCTAQARRCVSELRLLGKGELSADHASWVVRRYGGWRLLRDAFLRVRSGDGFSPRSGAWSAVLPGRSAPLIALSGLASKLGDPIGLHLALARSCRTPLLLSSVTGERPAAFLRGRHRLP